MAGFAQVAAGTKYHLSLTKLTVLLIDSPPLIMLVCFTGHPLDTVKVRLQTQSSTNPEFEVRFRLDMQPQGLSVILKSNDDDDDLN